MRNISTSQITTRPSVADVLRTLVIEALCISERMTNYDHNYPTCLETYATLRVWSADLVTEDVSATLGVSPTKVLVKGDLRSGRASPKRRYFDEHGWFFSTKEHSDSRDCRWHLDLLVERVLGDGAGIKLLTERGCRIDIVVFYSYTQGGPTMSPVQMEALAKAGVDVWWDLYRGEDND